MTVRPPSDGRISAHVTVPSGSTVGEPRPRVLEVMSSLLMGDCHSPVRVCVCVCGFVWRCVCGVCARARVRACVCMYENFVLVGTWRTFQSASPILSSGLHTTTII